MMPFFYFTEFDAFADAYSCHYALRYEIHATLLRCHADDIIYLYC